MNFSTLRAEDVLREEAWDRYNDSMSVFQMQIYN